jgi:hypothetical protein
VTHTRGLHECPEGVKIAGCKWAFTIRRTATGEIESYRACLITKGYSQVNGVDYDETHAPVTGLAPPRTIPAIAARNDRDVDVFGFHSGFLNWELGMGDLTQHKKSYYLHNCWVESSVSRDLTGRFQRGEHGCKKSRATAINQRRYDLPYVSIVCILVNTNPI